MEQDLFSDTKTSETVSLCVCTVEAVCPDEANLLVAQQCLLPGFAEPEGPALVLRLPEPAIAPLAAHSGADASLTISTSLSPAGQYLSALFVQVGSVQLRLVLELANTETMRLMGDALASRRLQFLICTPDQGPFLTFQAEFQLADSDVLSRAAAGSAWLPTENRCIDLAEAAAQLAFDHDSGVVVDTLTRHIVVAAQLQSCPNPHAFMALINGQVFGFDGDGHDDELDPLH